MSDSCTQASESSLHSFRPAIKCDTKPKEASSFTVYVTAFFSAQRRVKRGRCVSLALVGGNEIHTQSSHES